MPGLNRRPLLHSPLSSNLEQKQHQKMPLSCASWNTCCQWVTTKVGWKLGSALLIKRWSQAITHYKTKETFPSWWPGLHFLNQPWCSTSPETYMGTKLKNHCWRLPHYYMQVVENSETAHQIYIPKVQQYKDLITNFKEKKHLYP